MPGGHRPRSWRADRMPSGPASDPAARRRPEQCPVQASGRRCRSMQRGSGSSRRHRSRARAMPAATAGSPAAGRPTGRAVGVPRIPGRREGGRLGERPDGQFRQLRLADDHAACRSQPGDKLVVGRRSRVRRRRRPHPGRLASYVDVVLDGDRHASQWQLSQVVAVAQRRCLTQGLFVANQLEGPDRWLPLGDPVQVSLDSSTGVMRRSRTSLAMSSARSEHSSELCGAGASLTVASRRSASGTRHRADLA